MAFQVNMPFATGSMCSLCQTTCCQSQEEMTPCLPWCQSWMKSKPIQWSQQPHRARKQDPAWKGSLPLPIWMTWSLIKKPIAKIQWVLPPMAWVHGAAKLRAIFADPAWCHFWQWLCICLAISLYTCLGISLPCFGNADTFPCASHFWQCWHMPTYAAIFGNFHSSCKASARLCPSQAFRPTAAMEVTIQTSVAIKVGDEKAISIPPTFWWNMMAAPSWNLGPQGTK